MRAHFGDVVVSTGPGANTATADNVANEKIDIGQQKCEGGMRARIDEFKQDSQNMEVLSNFIDEVLRKAEEEASKQQQTRNAKNMAQPKEKSRQSFNIPDFKNGKVVNRARGLVVRLFDAICNCANTAAAAPAQRFKLRGKRAASMSCNSTAAAGSAGGTGGVANSIGGSVDAGGGDANIALAALEAAVTSKKENGKVKENGGKKDGDKANKKKKEEEPMLPKGKGDDAGA